MNPEAPGYSLHVSERMAAFAAFAGGVSHDFNNLLLVMLVFGDMIRAACPPSDPRLPDINELMRAIERAQALAGDLLEFSRQEPTEAPIVNLNAMTTDFGAMLRRTLPTNVEIVTRVAEGTWPIRIDPQQIKNVITNIAVAAKDAMPDGGCFTLEIANETTCISGAETSGAGGVLLKVSDSGPAIDPALLPRIFEPYFAAKKLGRGTGLGLAACYAAVARSSGTITVTSEIGRGTSFIILLPRAADARVVVARSPAPVEEGGSGPHNVILVADDDASVMRAAANILRNNGYTVLTASDGAEARQMLQRDGERINLVLTDLSMPRLGGPELDRYLKVHWPKMPLVFMSGSSEQVPPEGGLLLINSRRAVMKPFRARDLLSVIREALND